MGRMINPEQDPDTFEEAIGSVFYEAVEVLLRKRKEYGTENINEQGLEGVLVRVQQDKLSRARNFVKTKRLRRECAERGMPQEVIDEHIPPPNEDEDSLEDDLTDAINYIAIALLLEREWWNLPDRRG